MAVAVIEPETELKTEPKTALESRLEDFCRAVDYHDCLEIDGDIQGDTLDSHYLKILNHDLKSAYAISLKSIMDNDTEDLVDALETGVTMRLYGITRIVGYFSRTNNWNKSKLGELKDRHKGNYSVKAVA